MHVRQTHVTQDLIELIRQGVVLGVEPFQQQPESSVPGLAHRDLAGVEAHHQAFVDLLPLVESPLPIHLRAL